MKNYILFLFIFCSVFIGCAKENSDLFIPYKGNPANDTAWTSHLTANSVANHLFDSLVYVPFIDSFNVTGSALFHVNSNLDVAIPAGSITYTNGSAIPSGKVRVEIRHLLHSGDFIRYAKPTTSYGKLMESASGIQIRFFKQNQELALQQGKKLFFTIKDPNPDGDANVYFGNITPQAPFPTGTNPFFNWTLSTDSSFVSPFVHHDSTGVTKGYQMFAGKINWINTQYFIDSLSLKTQVTSTLPANFTNTNTTMFVIIKQHKIVAQLNGDFSSHTFSAPNIPTGSSVIFVSLSLIGNQYYLGAKEATVTKNLVTIVNPSPKTKAEINQFLDRL